MSKQSFRDLKETIDLMISKLNEQELVILKKKFGENLDNLVKRVSWEEGEYKAYLALYALTTCSLKRSFAVALKPSTLVKSLSRVFI